MGMRGRRLNYCHIVIFLLGPCLCSGLRVTVKEGIGHIKVVNHEEKKPKFTSQISTTQKDITTPITTVPTLTPTNPTTSSIPIVNPNSNPDSSSPFTMTPTLTPTTTTTTTAATPASLGSSWCVSSPSVSQTSLQVALDYACGYGGADCSAIQPGGSCYNPNNIRDHASYAFNSYYQKNPVPNSCNFAGTAVVTSTNPSTGTCLFPSTSTSSSVLNTTNSSGSTVFGAVPSGPPPPPTSAAAVADSSTSFPHLFIMTCFLVFLPK
ncbi:PLASMODESMATA CALLOSE-BINDING PROTEIN 2-like [Humulus lupulus]|uniref:PLASMODESMATA CALLOSE-BINDING PROTEIN 2-like n=1 Tax=Humulus lupulus TaxID=3486 RepID=UPI002B411082|nr:PLASMODESMATA CALLOSE-BINDING PROTEIN 2-like [Humulus lupulus]